MSIFSAKLKPIKTTAVVIEHNGINTSVPKKFEFRNVASRPNMDSSPNVYRAIDAKIAFDTLARRTLDSYEVSGYVPQYRSGKVIGYSGLERKDVVNRINEQPNRGMIIAENLVLRNVLKRVDKGMQMIYDKVEQKSKAEKPSLIPLFKGPKIGEFPKTPTPRKRLPTGFYAESPL